MTLPHFDLNKTDDDNDNSNYDSALENTDQEKSRSSRKDTGTISLERPSNKENCEAISCSNTTDVVNANNSLSEVMDSMNMLNLGFAKESSRYVLSLNICIIF